MRTHQLAYNDEAASGSPTKKSLGGFIRDQARDWARFHRELGDGIWQRVLVRTGGKRFTALYNTGARLRGVDVRTEFDPAQGRATVSSGGHTVEAYPQRRALNYARGIEARAKQLGEDYLLPLVAFSDGDVVIDCGANVGDLKLYFRHIGADVEYVAIEPGPGEFAVCERNVAPSRAINVGLWDSDGELTFYVSSNGADSSLIEPPSYDSVTRVPTRRLDTLVDYPRIRLFKLEAEGAEPEAIAGAAGLFDRIDYITADLGAERGKEQTSTLPEVTNYLLANGFELVAVNHRRVAALFRRKGLEG
ncbi:FkbM family methyltransferase [Tsuneonella sp. SYSU-LHT278]|uniref:FkbM family methyltransferase n=1 Tax=Tsuneonella sediminis TaxID=3416089 RepID=UPI003F79C898